MAHASAQNKQGRRAMSPACAGAPERKEEQETEQLDGAGHHSGDEKGWFCVCETFPATIDGIVGFLAEHL